MENDHRTVLGLERSQRPLGERARFDAVEPSACVRPGEEPERQLQGPALAPEMADGQVDGDSM
jgi:hypothetical protein